MQPVSIKSLNSAPAVTDSHAGECASYRLVQSWRDSVTLDGKTNPAISTRVYYPRVKKLQDGSYILLHMDYRLGGNVFISRSDDLVNWSPREKLFGAYQTLRDGVDEDKFMYATPDAAVLPNGELLVVCSFRYAKGYVLDSKYGGLMMKKSSDNGKTFSEERVIYIGRNWEPHVLVLKSGEIQVYFSHGAPKFYLDPSVRHESLIKTSSGAAIIRSFDGGESWTPNVTDAPYAAHRVSQSYISTMANGTKCFTDQMATAVELGDGSIALSCESDCGDYNFRVTTAVSHDNWAEPLGIDEAGPKDKAFAFTSGAGPYIAHFPSGETLLSFNRDGKQTILYGDEHGKNFRVNEPFVTFGGKWGYWGSLTVDTPHCMIAAYPNIREFRSPEGKVIRIDNDLMLGRLILNHRIDALPRTPDWAGNTDALFLGAASQAECALRVAYDEEKLYIRADRLDRYMTAADSIEVRVRVGRDIYTFGANLGGRSWFYKNDNPAEDFVGEAETELCGALDTWAGDENGAITVFSVPRAIVGSAEFFELDATLKNYDAGSVTEETLGGMMRVRIV